MDIPYHLFLFNIFINDIFDKCKKYGVITERKQKKNVVEAYLLMTLFCWFLLKSSLKKLLIKTYD